MFGDGMFVDAFGDNCVLSIFIDDEFEVSVSGWFFEMIVELCALFGTVGFVAHVVCNLI